MSNSTLKVSSDKISIISYLKTLAPFKGLEHKDLLVIAGQINFTELDANIELYDKGSYVNRLVLIVEGNLITTNKRSFDKIFGLKEILEDNPLEENIVTGKDGASFLWMYKKHLLTLMQELPQFNLGLLEEYKGAIAL